MNFFPTRRCVPVVNFHGANLLDKLPFPKWLLDISWNGVADGASDKISVGICASPFYNIPSGWMTTMFPKADDTVDASVLLMNWRFPGNTQRLALGQFVLDAPSGTLIPTTLSLNGVSQPAGKAFTETKRTQNWQNVSVQKIAGDMAQRAVLTLNYEGPDIQIKVKEQRGTPDAQFLQGICDDYGLCMKTYRDKLVVFDLATKKQAPPVAVFTPSDFSNLSFQKMQHGTYTGAKLVYSDAGKEEIIREQIGQGDRWLTVNQKTDDKADAQRVLRGKLEKANHGATKINFTLALADTRIVDGVCFQLLSTWSPHLDGKYFVDSVGLSVNNGGGCVMSGSASRCENNLQ